MRKLITIAFVTFIVLMLSGCGGETVPTDLSLDSFDPSSLESQIEELEEQISKLNVPNILNVPSDQVIQYGTDLDLLSLGVTATDVEDGILTEAISVNIDSTNELTLGNHLVEYTVIDSDNNTTKERINLEVQFYSDTFDYVVISNYSEIKITKYEIYLDEDIVIPAMVGGLPVTVIGNYSVENIYDDSSTRALVIPNTVTYIGNYAFAGLNLEEVVIPDSVQFIGDSAFTHNRLTNIVIPEGVTVISARAFLYNDLTSITLPSTLLTIGEEAFAVNNLITVDIPEGVVTIGDSAFTRNKLTNVTLPSTLTSIGDWVFRDNRLTTITLPESLEVIGGGVIASNSDFEAYIVDENNIHFKVLDNILYSFDETTIYHALLDSSLTEYTIPEGVTTIVDKAFFEANLESVTFPSTLESIGEAAFAQSAFISVTIPASVTTIGYHPFRVYLLQEFIILGDSDRFNDMWYEIGLPAKFGPPIVLQPDTDFSYFVNDEGDGIIISEFIGSEYSNILIPDYVNGLPVVEIAEGAFQYKNLVKVSLPSTLITIGSEAFYQNQLTDIIIPESVISISEYAFYRNEFTSITILGDEHRFDDMWTFIGFPQFLNPQFVMQDGLMLDIVSGMIVQYISEFGGDVVIPSTIDGVDVTGINDYVFGNANLDSVSFSNTLTTIGYQSFAYNGLTEIVIPASVTSISNNAFYGNSFTSITILGDEYRFNNVWESIGFPTNLKPIGVIEPISHTVEISKSDDLYTDDYIIEDGSYTIPILNVGEISDDIVLRISNVSLEAEQSYQISFNIVTEVNRTINIMVFKSTEPSTVLTELQFYTGDYTEGYAFAFTSYNTEDYIFEIQLGYYNEYSLAGTVTISNILINEIFE